MEVTQHLVSWDLVLIPGVRASSIQADNMGGAQMIPKLNIYKLI